MRKAIGFILSLIMFFLLTPAVFGIVEAAPPKDFQTTQIIGTGLNGPSGFEFAPDGRIFIIQRTGEVRVYKNGQLLTTNFAVLPSIASGDRGLIGVTFDPDFTTNHYAYFYYTGTDKLNRLVRFNATSDIGTDLTVLYQTSFPSEQLHVGGTVQFGPDGKLYFAVGDNGYGPNAQDLSNPHGKILRINKDGSIPTDNPFVGIPGALPEIWAYGMRNPWRFQFDKTSGRLYVGDVGADSWEEVNYVVRGGNYGWPNCEGTCVPTNAKYIDPVYTYPHSINGVYQSSAVTMGPIYHATMFPQSYQNLLFYGDYARGSIRTITLNTAGDASTGTTDFDMQAGSVVDLKVATDGSMYYITYYPGAMYRLTYNPLNHVPVANATANVVKGPSSPFTINFSSTGTYDPDNDVITYAWDFGDGTTSTQANPAKTFTKDGTYTVELTVSDGKNLAQARPLIVQIGCPPNVTIGTPKDGSTYKSGDTVTINASAIDCAGFDINDAALSTTVKLHHTTHVHPFLDSLPGRSHSFTVPTDGEPSADTWFEIDVTATDTNGLATTAVTQIYPQKSNMTFATQPAGLQILVDGIPTGTTQVIQGVVGFNRELNVSSAAQKASDGKYYIFDHWSDGGAQRHVIATPAASTTYTAVFAETTAPLNAPLAYTIYDELLGGDWIDWSWGSANDFGAVTSYTGSNALGWTAKSGWAGLLFHRNELPLDLNGFDAVTVALRATTAGQKIRMQFYDETDLPVGKEIDLSNYGGDPIAGTYKVYTIPLADFGVVGKKVSDVHLQNYTDTAQPVMYVDRFGLTSSTATVPTPTVAPTAMPTAMPTTQPTPTVIPTVMPTAVPTIQPTTTPIVTPTPGNSLVQNASFETTLTPWHLDVQTGATATIAQDTTTAFEGKASAKINVTKANTSNTWYVQLAQDNLALVSGKQYTVSFAAKAAASRTIEAVVQQNVSPYTVYATKSISITTAWKVYSFTFVAPATDNKAFIGFNLAAKTGNVWFDSVSVCPGVCSVVPTVTPTVQPTIVPTSGPTVTPTPTQTPSAVTYIYDEKLADGWVDWTWSSTTNFADTSHPYKGSKNLLWKPQAQWAGFLPADEAGFDTTGYTAFTFAVQATKPNQKINVQLYTFNDVELGVNTDIAKYGGDPVVGQYKVYTIPLSDLDGVNKKLLKFHIQDGSGNATNVIYLDAVGFVKTSATVTPTPTQAVPTPTQPAVTPTPTPVATTLPIYGDALASGWESWSWDSVLDFAVNSPVFSGSKAISYVATAAWSGMDIHNQTGVSTAKYTTLHFALKASQAGQQYAVFLEGANSQQLKTPINLSALGGNPTADAWKEYSISLADLNATNTTITGVVIHEISGNAQPAVFVDDIYFK